MSYNEYGPRKWTKKRCFEEGAKFATRGKFKMKYPSAYKAAKEKGWLDEIFEDKPFHGYRSERVMLSQKNLKDIVI